MPEQKTPVSGAFWLASLMYFCSGQPMHFCSGVDNRKFWNFGCGLVALSSQSLLAIFQFPFRHARDRFDM